MRRALVIVAGCGLLAGLALLANFAVAQPLLKKKPPAGGPATLEDKPTDPGLNTDDADVGRALLPVPPTSLLKQKLQAAADYVRTRDWVKVAEILQNLLEQPSDYFVMSDVIGADGKKTRARIGQKYAANRMLGELPAEGLLAYRLQNDQNAKKILDDAIASGDKSKFADVAFRYLWTESGGEAAERLASIALDRGDFMMAAQAFDRVIQRTGLDNLDSTTLFKMVIAYDKSGTKDDAEKKDKVWKQLQIKSPDGIPSGGQLVSYDDVLKMLASIKAASSASKDGAPTFGGDESRNAQSIGGPAFLQARWRQSLLIDKYEQDGITLRNKGDTDHIRTLLADAVRSLELSNKPVLPAFYPIAVTAEIKGQPTPIVIYRTHDGLAAHLLKGDKLIWKTHSTWSLQEMVEDKHGNKSGALSSWLGSFASKPQVLLENSTVGSLSSDGTRVYAVDDLAVPSPPPFQYNPNFGGMQQQPIAGVMNDGVQASKLCAFGIGSGLLLWELGGRPGNGETVTNDPKDFRDSYFVGAPLCLGGKIFFLNEKKENLNLVCMDPARVPKNPSVKQLQDAILWVQPLCSPKTKITADYTRRMSAAHIACGEGVLVCPTNSGVLLGVDLLSHSLIWAYAYESGMPSASTNPNDMLGGGFRGRPYPQQNIGPSISEWKTSAPIIAEGKVIFTAPDGKALTCLSLRNGAKLWSLDRTDDKMFLAGVHNGRVLVVTKSHIEADSLENGSVLWHAETGVPSGRGVASNGIYYLPVKKIPSLDKEPGPGIVAVNMETGQVVATTRARKNGNEWSEYPGNLIFFDGYVIAQSATEIAVYPQLEVQEREVLTLLAKNPNDPIGLYKRGELRLDKGERRAAVEDLRLALANKPPEAELPHVKERLFQAMTELLQREFDKGQTYLEEYESLCKADTVGETRRRQAVRLSLMAKGREAERRFGESLRYYLEFGALASDDELMPVVDEPLVRARPDVWARARITSMIRDAKPQEREALEKAIVDQINEARQGDDLLKLRRLVGMFGSSNAGKEARLELAERMAESGKASFLESELELAKLCNDEDPNYAARAMDSRARLMMRNEQLENAFKLYQDLKRDYPNVKVRDGKTGAELLDDLFADKRFYQFQDTQQPAPAPKPAAPAEGEKRTRMTWRYDVTANGGGQGLQLYTLEAENDVLPSIRALRVAIDFSNNGNRFKLVDRHTNKDVMSEQLKNAPNMPIYIQHLSQLNAQVLANPARLSEGSYHFGYHAVGHLLVMSLGQTVIAVDSLSKKVLWEKSLLGSQGVAQAGNIQVDYTDGTFWVMTPDGKRFNHGQLGPVSPAAVTILTRDGLTAYDPLTGKTLWTRSDVSLHSKVFGDDKHIFVVEVNENNQPTSSRAFRAQDGVTVNVPGFDKLYSQRVRVMGRSLLVADSTGGPGLTLKLYDIVAGKDVWSKSFPAGSVVLRSDDPDLSGAVDPDGNATIINLRTQKSIGVLLRPEHVKKIQMAYVLQDGQNFYVMTYTPDANVAGWGPPQPNVITYLGMRSIPVSGGIYAYGKTSGKLKWIQETENQHLILDNWKDSPVLFLTSRYYGAAGRIGGMQSVGIALFDKTSGKTVFEKKDLPQTVQQFFGVHELKNGKLEYTATNYKISIWQEAEEAATKDKPKEEGKPGAGAGTGAGQGAGEVVPQPVPPIRGRGRILPPNGVKGALLPLNGTTLSTLALALDAAENSVFTSGQHSTIALTIIDSDMAVVNQLPCE